MGGVSMTGRIGVLGGGDSPERAVSLLSARSVYNALQPRHGDVQLIQIEGLDDLVPKLQGVDVAFNCLHGGAGEDGTVRLLLDVMGIACIGSGALACARAMDKSQAKALFRAAEIPTPLGVDTDAASLDEALQSARDHVPYPRVLKPPSGGSTIAVHLADDEASARDAAASILATSERVLIEAFIPGREVTVGILRIDGSEIALPVVEIRFSEPLFDYQAKYQPGCAEFLAPAPLPDTVAKHVQAVALQAHHALGCTGFSRVDLRLGGDDTPYVLEVNALPGMTPLSDLPRAAAAFGIDYVGLVEIMLATAMHG
jgi:D-alanine-D-alanine ligase